MPELRGPARAVRRRLSEEVAAEPEVRSAATRARHCARDPSAANGSMTAPAPLRKAPTVWLAHGVVCGAVVAVRRRILRIVILTGEPSVRYIDGEPDPGEKETPGAGMASIRCRRRPHRSR